MFQISQTSFHLTTHLSSNKCLFYAYCVQNTGLVSEDTLVHLMDVAFALLGSTSLQAFLQGPLGWT